MTVFHLFTDCDTLFKRRFKWLTFQKSLIPSVEDLEMWSWLVTERCCLHLITDSEIDYRPLLEKHTVFHTMYVQNPNLPDLLLLFSHMNNDEVPVCVLHEKWKQKIRQIGSIKTPKTSTWVKYFSGGFEEQRKAIRISLNSLQGGNIHVGEEHRTDGPEPIIESIPSGCIEISGKGQ